MRIAIAGARVVGRSIAAELVENGHEVRPPEPEAGDEGCTPRADTVVQEGELGHLVVRDADLPAAEALFVRGPEDH